MTGEVISDIYIYSYIKDSNVPLPPVKEEKVSLNDAITKHGSC